MFNSVIYLFLASFLISTTVTANSCSYGNFLGFADANEFISQVPHTSSREYHEKQAPFIKGIRVTQIKNTFESKSVAEALASADDGIIYKIEIRNQEQAPYDQLTAIYAYLGDTLVGAVFIDDSAVPVAKLSDGDILVCDSTQ